MLKKLLRRTVNELLCEAQLPREADASGKLSSVLSSMAAEYTIFRISNGYIVTMPSINTRSGFSHSLYYCKSTQDIADHIAKISVAEKLGVGVGTEYRGDTTFKTMTYDSSNPLIKASIKV